jgi:hypothetical protein
VNLRGKLKRIRMVIVNCPNEMIEIAASYDETMIEDSLGLTNIHIKGEMWKELNKVTTKELKSTLKVALNKVSSQDFNTRLGKIYYNKEFIVTFRNQCKNVKLRHIYFRLVSKDFSQWKRCLSTRWLTVTSVVDVGKWNLIDIHCGTVEREKESGKHLMHT